MERGHGENLLTKSMLSPRPLDGRKLFCNLCLKVLTISLVVLARPVAFLVAARSGLWPNIRGDLGGDRKRTLPPMAGKGHGPTRVLDKLLRPPVSLSLLYRTPRPPVHSRLVLSRSRCRPKAGSEQGA
jgi:hypothetical protein